MKDVRHPVIKIPTQVVVYTPAVPLRCVAAGWLNGEGYVKEFAVLGIQVVIGRTYQHRPIPNTESDPVPDTFGDESIRDAGYRPRPLETEFTSHHVVIWDEEYGVVPLDGSLLDTDSFIIGPVTNPPEWWEAKIAAKQAGK